jgi:hypothetical protein
MKRPMGALVKKHLHLSQWQREIIKILPLFMDDLKIYIF